MNLTFNVFVINSTIAFEFTGTYCLSSYSLINILSMQKTCFIFLIRKLKKIFQPYHERLICYEGLFFLPGKVKVIIDTIVKLSPKIMDIVLSYLHSTCGMR